MAKPLGSQKGNSVNLRVVANLLGMEGVEIVTTTQTCQRDCAATVKSGPKSTQGVCAELAEKPRQASWARFLPCVWCLGACQAE